MKSEPAKGFQDLIVWQKAHEFVLSPYHLRRGFPSMRRMASLASSGELPLLFRLTYLKNLTQIMRE